MNSLPEGLDQRFLKFIGVTEETERVNHAFFLKFFQPGQQVLDLGCGAGYFVKMLSEVGVNATGIDLDPAAVTKAQTHGLSVIQAEALSYLQELPSESLDAIFSAHLIEHLEVETVFSLIQASYRVLRPGGFLLLTTPNVRALFSHLEMFWLHFDHKRFYHPRLVEFFMRECQFGEISYGENGKEQNYYYTATGDDITVSEDKFNWNSVIPRPKHPVMLPWWWFKNWLARLVVLPYLATLIPLQYIGRYFEVYVIGYKTNI
jgi:SAM-dependent methyltransferase